jgi:hypothetical protein
MIIAIMVFSMSFTSPLDIAACNLLFAVQSYHGVHQDAHCWDIQLGKLFQSLSPTVVPVMTPS